MFFGLENKRHEKFEELNKSLEQADEKFQRLQRDNLQLMEQRDQARSNVSLFQGALEQKNKEKEQVEAQLTVKESLLSEKDLALAKAIKRAKEAELALKTLNDSLPSMEE